MLIFLAALKQIPGSLYESAMVDGAKQWTMFWKITLPMLTPTIFFNLILQIVNGFRVFTESYVITDGGPLDSTLSYVLYLYRRAFTYFDQTGIFPRNDFCRLRAAYRMINESTAQNDSVW